MKNDARIIYYMIFTLVLVLGLTISASFLLADAWEQPTGDTPSGGFIRPVENEGDDVASYVTRPVSVDNNFLVGTDDLFVDASTGQVGIGTTNPTVALDVNGPVQLGSFLSLPTCDVSVLGAFAFNTNDNRASVCTNTGWQRLHVDVSGTGHW